MLLSLPINCQTQSTKDQALQLLLAVQVNAGWRELPGAGDRLWRKRRAARTVAALQRLVPLSPSAGFRFLRRVRTFFSAAIIMGCWQAPRCRPIAQTAHARSPGI